jgi:hypothetical protein
MAKVDVPRSLSLPKTFFRGARLAFYGCHSDARGPRAGDCDQSADDILDPGGHNEVKQRRPRYLYK